MNESGCRWEDEKNDGESVHTLDIRTQFPSPQFPVIPVPHDSWRNGMAVRMPNHLGDAVMALPALGQLRRILPEHCALFVIAPVGQKALYSSLPIVDGTILLERIHSGWSREEIRNLRQYRLGVGVLFNNSLRDAMTMKLAGVGRLYGAAARCRSIFLTRSFHFPPRPVRRLAGIHQSNKCLAMARAMGAPEWDGSLPEFELAPPVDELFGNITSLCEHPKLLTLASGAAYGAAKRWPSECFREVARHWIEKEDGIAVVLGSASEKGIGDEVVEGLRPTKAFNLCGKTWLAELMHLLKNSRLTVANDSGIMHLSAALGCPGIAVFGPTDYTATGPISPAWRLMYRKIDCAPCFKRECPHRNPRCIRQITPEMVIAEMRKITTGN